MRNLNGKEQYIITAIVIIFGICPVIYSDLPSADRIRLVLFILILSLLPFLIRQRGRRPRLHKKDVSRTLFFNSILHDVRTPLNSIISISYLMQKNIGNPEEMTGLTDRLKDTTEYLMSLINNVLDYGKLSADKMDFHMEAVSIKELAGSFQNIMSDTMKARNIHYNVTCNIDSPYIIGDRTRIKQAVLNILGNAAKYTGENGNVTLRIYQEDMGDTMVMNYFEVEDDGTGMSSEFLEHIFEAYSQERNPEWDNGTGEDCSTGLGMTISYMIAKHMNGELKVISEPFRGSRFIFMFPAWTTMGSEDGVNAAVTEVPFDISLYEKYMGKPDYIHILYADDNKANLQLMSEIFEVTGLRADFAGDGKELYNKFADSSEYFYDIILVDDNMPHMNGFTAVSKIRKMQREDASKIKIYAHTADSSEDTRRRAEKAGVDGVIIKPADIAELMQIIQSAKDYNDSIKEDNMHS